MPHGEKHNRIGYITKLLEERVGIIEKFNSNFSIYIQSTRPESVEFDPTSLHRKKSGKGSFMLDDNGKGILEAWRVQKNELVMIRPELRGMFFAKNCYVIKYTSANKRGGVVYFWQVKFMGEK